MVVLAFACCFICFLLRTVSADLVCLLCSVFIVCGVHVGSGDAVCVVLSTLTDIALRAVRFTFQQPVRKDEYVCLSVCLIISAAICLSLFLHIIRNMFFVVM